MASYLRINPADNVAVALTALTAVNGAPVRNESNGIREISIFKKGVTL